MSKFLLAKFKINKFEKEIEPQEILLDSLARKKEKEIGISGKKLETPISQRGLLGIWLGFLILILIFWARTFQLQIVEGKTLSELSEKNRFIIKSIQAERGVIYDRNLNQLIFNKPSFDFICNGKVISEDLDHQTLIFFETSIEEYPGCEVENNTVREYKGGQVFSQVIGYYRPTGEKAGLENYYDNILQPKLGQLQIKRDVYGNLISKNIVSMPESGQSLVLWLDSGLQEKLYNSLGNSIKSVGAEAGAAIAIDPQSGGVMAMVSYPSYDSNLFSQGISKEQWELISNNPSGPLFNRAISGLGYPTGSTIKPFIGVAALEEGIISPGAKIYSPLEICIQNPWFPEKKDCYADWKYHGDSDLKRAIAESVNTFFYQVGGGYEDFKGLGAKKIKKWLEIFGLGSQTGIDLPKEGKGVLPDIENNWRLGDTYHLSIGQGSFAMTPLQVAAAYQAIANSGKVYRPRLVKGVVDDTKNFINLFNSEISSEIPVKSEYIEVVRQGMRQAVTFPENPSHILSDLPVKAAAKTGTAQTGRKEGDEEFYHHWVTVFAPYENPQIVLVVVIENVKGVQAASLPVAKEVLGWYFSTLDKDSR